MKKVKKRKVKPKTKRNSGREKKAKPKTKRNLRRERKINRKIAKEIKKRKKTQKKREKKAKKAERKIKKKKAKVIRKREKIERKRQKKINKKIKKKIINKPNVKEEKGEKLLFFRVVPIAIAMLFINILTFIGKYGKGNGVTGFSISSTISEIKNSMPSSSKTFLIIQWSAMGLLLVYLLFRDKNILKTEKEVKSLDLPHRKKEQKTDLDTLYNILQEKGKIRISTIAKAFKINKELANEWARTLEEGKLAIIDYPSFGGSVLKLKERKKKRFF